MSSDTNLYGGISSIEVLEGFHQDFAGLIEIANKQGPYPGELEGYKDCQERIQARIACLRGARPTE